MSIDKISFAFHISACHISACHISACHISACDIIISLLYSNGTIYSILLYTDDAT